MQRSRPAHHRSKEPDWSTLGWQGYSLRVILLFTALASAQDALDEDADGLSSREERHFRTDPLDPDSDSDGILDGIEASIGLDPMRPDSDGDGRPDGREIIQGTDPRAVDALPTRALERNSPEPEPEVEALPVVQQPRTPEDRDPVRIPPRQRSALPSLAVLLVFSTLFCGLLLIVTSKWSNIRRSVHGNLRSDGKRLS